MPHLFDAFLLAGLRLFRTLGRQRVIEHIFQPPFRGTDFFLGHIATRHGIDIERVGPRIERIHDVILVLPVIHDGRVAGQQPALRERIGRRQILQVVAQIDALVDRVKHLGVLVEVHRAGSLVVVEHIAPGIVRRVEHEHVVGEVDHLVRAVIPARIGAQESVAAPHVGIPSEIGLPLLREVAHRLRLDLDRIEEEFRALFEREEPLLAVVGTLAAFDDAAVLVFERAAVLEHGHAVLRVVGQAVGTERVAVLVDQLDDLAAELGPALVDPVLHLLAFEHGLVLDQLHVAEGLDELGIYVPGSRVTEQISVVVEEARMPLDQAVLHAEPFVLFGTVSLDEPEEAVFGRFLLLGQEREAARQKQQQERRYAADSSHTFT